MSELQNTPNTIELAADIVSAFVSNNSVPATELPALIGSVHEALNRVASGSTEQPEEEPKVQRFRSRSRSSRTTSSAWKTGSGSSR